MAHQTLLDLARSGDRVQLVEKLELVSRKIHNCNVHGLQLSLNDQLIDEALTYARLGDLDEATYRLSLRSRSRG